MALMYESETVAGFRHVLQRLGVFPMVPCSRFPEFLEDLPAAASAPSFSVFCGGGGVRAGEVSGGGVLGGPHQDAVKDPPQYAHDIAASTYPLLLPSRHRTPNEGEAAAEHLLAPRNLHGTSGTPDTFCQTDGTWRQFP